MAYCKVGVIPLRYVLTRLPPGQNGRHFTDDIFEYIFMNDKFCILIEVSVKFVLEGHIDNQTALVQAIDT